MNYFSNDHAIEPMKNDKNYDFLKHFMIQSEYYELLLNYLNNNEKNNCILPKLLNTDKSKYTIIEKYIDEISKFHLSKLKINNTQKVYIEFWYYHYLESNSNIIKILHFDKDEIAVRKKRKMIHPSLSTITYLNDSIYPTLITNLTRDKLINKDKNSCLQFSFPKKCKHITFNGNKLHGSVNILNNNIEIGMNKIESRKALMFNIWIDHKPEDIEYYINDGLTNNPLFNKEENLFLIKDMENSDHLFIPLENDLLNELSYDIILRRQNIKNLFTDYLTKETIENNSNIIFIPKI